MPTDGSGKATEKQLVSFKGDHATRKSHAGNFSRDRGGEEKMEELEEVSGSGNKGD